MFFQVTNLEENTTQGNVTKVSASLRTGVIEVLEGHIDMIGRIDDDILVSESIVEGRVVKKRIPNSKRGTCSFKWWVKFRGSKRYLCSCSRKRNG